MKWSQNMYTLATLQLHILKKKQKNVFVMTGKQLCGFSNIFFLRSVNAESKGSTCTVGPK